MGGCLAKQVITFVWYTDRQYVSIHSCEQYAYIYRLHMGKVVHLDLWNGFVGLYVRDVVMMLENGITFLFLEHGPA